MKIAIITALNNRPQVSQIMLNCVERLQKDFRNTGIRLYASVHTPGDADLVRRYLHSPIWVDENITGLKFNFALWEAISEKNDAYLIMGDDDCISSEYLDVAMAQIHQGHAYVGMHRCGFHDLASGKSMIYHQSGPKLIGAGRMISAKAVMETAMATKVIFRKSFSHLPEKIAVGTIRDMTFRQASYFHELGYVKILDHHKYIGLWDSTQARTMDHVSEFRLALAGHTPFPVSFDDRIHITDFKSADASQSIWSYQHLRPKCHEITTDVATWFMSEKEKEYLQSISKSQVYSAPV